MDAKEFEKRFYFLQSVLRLYREKYLLKDIPDWRGRVSARLTERCGEQNLYAELSRFQADLSPAGACCDRIFICIRLSAEVPGRGTTEITASRFELFTYKVGSDIPPLLETVRQVLNTMTTDRVNRPSVLEEAVSELIRSLPAPDPKAVEARVRELLLPCVNALLSSLKPELEWNMLRTCCGELTRKQGQTAPTGIPRFYHPVNIEWASMTISVSEKMSLSVRTTLRLKGFQDLTVSVKADTLPISPVADDSALEKAVRKSLNAAAAACVEKLRPAFVAYELRAPLPGNERTTPPDLWAVLTRGRISWGPLTLKFPGLTPPPKWLDTRSFLVEADRDGCAARPFPLTTPGRNPPIRVAPGAPREYTLEDTPTDGAEPLPDLLLKPVTLNAVLEVFRAISAAMDPNRPCVVTVSPVSLLPLSVISDGRTFPLSDEMSGWFSQTPRRWANWFLSCAPKRKWEKSGEEDLRLLAVQELNAFELSVLRYLCYHTRVSRQEVMDNLPSDVFFPRTAIPDTFSRVVKLQIPLGGTLRSAVESFPVETTLGSYLVYTARKETERAVRLALPRPFRMEEAGSMTPRGQGLWLREQARNADSPERMWDVLSLMDHLYSSVTADFIRSEEGAAFLTRLTGPDRDYARIYCGELRGCKTVVEQLLRETG